jgi:hypothetical protein
MPRYMLQRTRGLQIPIANGGAEVCSAVIERNVQEDRFAGRRRVTSCPVDRISAARVLDPYFYN